MIFRSFLRTILTLGLSAACFLTSLASEDNEDYSDDAHFGLRVDFDLNHSHNWGQFLHWSPGGSVGGAYYAPFGKFTYFNVGVLFSYSTFDYHGTSGTKYHPYDIDGSMWVVGLKMPLDFGFKYYENKNVRLSVYSGPQLYFNFSIETEFDYYGKNDTQHIKKKIDNSGMEIAWSIGTAIDFKQRWHLQFEYNHALSNLGVTGDFIPNTLANIKRGELSLGLGYNF